MTPRPTSAKLCAATVGATTLILALAMAAAPGGGAPEKSQADLARVRAATAAYHDVERAVADGYVDLGLCFDQMGEHYGLPDQIDGVVDAEAPEALVYAHVGDRLKLVAVEWVATGPGQVLGEELDFNPAVQLWVKHAWVWMHNPSELDGIFAHTNPNVGDCPDAE